MENFTEILNLANSGDAVAQYKLGRAYESGDGVEKNLQIALDWYAKSADNGYKNAEMKLKMLSSQKSSQQTAAAPMASTSNTNSPVSSANTAYVAPSAPTINQNNNFVAKAGTTQSSKKKSIAAILAFFFGYYGIHDFYLGYNKNGIIKIVLTLTIIGSFVSMIWSLVDMVKILTGKKNDSNGYILI